MKTKNYFSLAIVSACFAFSCEQSHPFDIECQGSEQYCVDSHIFICADQTFVQDEQCVNGCDESKWGCRCVGCVNGCKRNGACVLAEGCVNGWEKTGVCKCASGCVNGCDETGVCKCAEGCVNGCDKTGACNCADDCVNGCDATGACKCVEGCVNGCDATGACKCVEGCVNGCDETGVCKCAEGCVNGCDEKGNCTCPSDCTTSCNSFGKCQCNDKCPDVCRANGNCMCQTGDASCTSETELKECYDYVWVTKTCSVGCHRVEEDNSDARDACIPFVCHEGEVQCKPENDNTVQNNTVQKCKDNAWKDEQTECEFGCYKGKCITSEFIQLDPDNESIRLLATSITTESTKSVVARYLLNGELAPGELSVTASNANCVVIDKKTLEDGKYQLTMTVSANAQKCNTAVFLKAGEAEKKMDVRVYGSNEDANGNHLLDYYETATKQGEDCNKYSDCNSDNGEEIGFCDSFIGYECSTKCKEDVQCVPDETKDGNTFHYICRQDGRCAPDTFETVWRTKTENDNVVIYLNHAQECQFSIDWGDKGSVHKSSQILEIQH